MQNLKYLNKFFFKYKWHLLLGVIFIAFTNLFKVSAPVIVQQSIDFLEPTIQAVDSAELDFPELPPAIELSNDIGITEFEPIKKPVEPQTAKDYAIKISLTLALIFFTIYIIQGLFLFLTRVTIIIMSRRIEFDLKNEIYKHYQKLSLAFYKRNSTGDLMNRISEDVSKVRMYLGPAVMYTLNLVFLIGFILYEMFQINAKLTLYSLMPLPFLSISIYYVSSIIHKKSEKVQKQQSDLSGFVQESISGIRVLKAYNRVGAFSNFFKSKSDNYKKLALDLVKVEALFLPLIVLLVGLSTVLAIYLGALEVLKNNGFSTGDIFQFIIYVNMLTWPFASVGWVTSLINKAEASQKRINEFLTSPPEIVNSNQTPQTFNGKIEFKDVSFTYPDTGIEALKNINFTLKPGETLGITGKTGSGKSTLAALISRLYDTTSGDVLIDGDSIKSINLESYRNSLGIVPQDVFLFSDSIRNNISFGADNMSDEQIFSAAKSADIHENILGFKDQYNTLLGERGINLSGGQKQRISIARAIIKNPQILIFDDCLSAVDTQTEEKILSELKTIMSEKTSIIIGHRVSSIMHADKLLVLENGQISETGTHQELINKGGYYASLYEKQLTEN